MHNIDCPDCRGTGQADATRRPCLTCRGEAMRRQTNFAYLCTCYRDGIRCAWHRLSDTDPPAPAYP